MKWLGDLVKKDDFGFGLCMVLFLSVLTFGVVAGVSFEIWQKEETKRELIRSGKYCVECLKELK